MKKLLLLILLFTVCLYSSAQNAKLYFDKFNIQKGLPEGQVSSIFEDSQGYIWMATQDGLVKYDGYQYKIYNLGDDKLNVMGYTSIASIFEDSKKTLWITTVANGVFRYDRTTGKFEQFVYPERKLSAVFDIGSTDAAGNLCGIFTDEAKRIAVFDVGVKKWEFFGKHEKGVHYINVDDFTSARKTSDGRLWFGSVNGLYAYDGPGKSLKAYFATNDTIKQRGFGILTEAASEPGILWVDAFDNNTKSSRLVRFDTRSGTKKEYFPSKDPFSIISDTVWSAVEDKQKRLFFGTQHGLSFFDRSTGRFTNYIPNDTAKGPRKNRLTRLRSGKDGKIWMISDYGLVEFNQATSKFIYHRPDDNDPGAISSNRLTLTMFDHTGVLWIGTNYSGAHRVNKVKSAFSFYKKIATKPDSYRGRPANVTPMPDGSCMVTDDKNIYKWLPGTNKFTIAYSADHGIDYRGAAVQGKDGTLYVGSTVGLLVYNTHTGKKTQYAYNAKDTTTIASNNIAQLLFDHSGILWIGTDDQHGVCSFDPLTKKFTRYPYRTRETAITAKNANYLDDSGVLALYEDRENNLWIGTNLGGLNLFNPKTRRFTNYFNDKNKKLTCVLGILEDKNKKLWVSTYLNGVFEFDRQTGTYIKNINEQSGLLFNAVMALSEDAAGRLWMTSERGISRLDTKTMSIKNFPISGVMPGNEFLLSTGSSIPKLADGSFCVSLNNGLVVFNPKELDENPYPPIVHVEDIVFTNPRGDDKVFNRVIAYGNKTIDATWNQNRVQFNYVALHYDDPQDNTYSYKMDGYDKQWVQAGTSRSVTYTNLPTGTYTFHVKAANSSGVWNNTGESITIIIHPPWWFTWWMRLIYLMMFIWAIIAFIKYRSRKLKRENQLLEEKILIRTSQLSEANKELSEQQEEITAQRDHLEIALEQLKSTQTQLIQSEKMASLGELTAGIAHEIQNPLNFVNNFSEVSIELLDELKEEIQAGNNEEVIVIATDLTQNLEKINHHGKRADAIVKGMLEHSRASTGQKEPTDINALADEYLRLAYHGLRAKDKSFNAELVTDFDEKLPVVNVIQQDIGRVLLNLFNNAFYAVNQKAKTGSTDYKPQITVSTHLQNNQIVIQVKDNGNGIPNAIKDKIMQPFFTTKPTGEGTGLGLSLSFDIVVKGHGGDMMVNTKEGEGSVFIVQLPVS